MTKLWFLGGGPPPERVLPPEGCPPGASVLENMEKIIKIWSKSQKVIKTTFFGPKNRGFGVRKKSEGAIWLSARQNEAKFDPPFWSKKGHFWPKMTPFSRLFSRKMMKKWPNSDIFPLKIFLSVFTKVSKMTTFRWISRKMGQKWPFLALFWKIPRAPFGSPLGKTGQNLTPPLIWTLFSQNRPKLAFFSKIDHFSSKRDPPGGGGGIYRSIPVPNISIITEGRALPECYPIGSVRKWGVWKVMKICDFRHKSSQIVTDSKNEKKVTFSGKTPLPMVKNRHKKSCDFRTHPAMGQLNWEIWCHKKVIKTPRGRGYI